MTAAATATRHRLALAVQSGRPLQVAIGAGSGCRWRRVMADLDYRAMCAELEGR